MNLMGRQGRRSGLAGACRGGRINKGWTIRLSKYILLFENCEQLGATVQPLAGNRSQPHHNLSDVTSYR